MTNKFLKKLFPVDEEDKIELGEKLPKQNQEYLIDTFESEFEVERKIENIEPSVNKSSFTPVVLTPKEYSEVEHIALEIMKKQTIIVSLDNFVNNSENKHLATRVIDFLAGVCFTQNIEIKRISSTAFMFTPRG